MEKTLLNKLEAGETLGMYERAVILKKETGIENYRILDTMLPAVDIFEFFFTENQIKSFSVTCSDEQNFIGGLNYISGFKITGVVESGEKFELTFNTTYLDADDILDVDDDREYIGNEEWDERTTDWSSESSVDTESDLYKFFLKQAEVFNMEISVLKRELEQIAEHCTGSDVEY